MREEHGEVAGPLTISDDYALHGMVSGDLVVESGGHLQLFGMVTGTLRITDGGSAIIRGMVSKDVLNAGQLEVHGMVIGLDIGGNDRDRAGGTDQRRDPLEGPDPLADRRPLRAASQDVPLPDGVGDTFPVVLNTPWSRFCEMPPCPQDSGMLTTWNASGMFSDVWP